VFPVGRHTGWIHDRHLVEDSNAGHSPGVYRGLQDPCARSTPDSRTGS
jgi:hypothetical protein